MSGLKAWFKLILTAIPFSLSHILAQTNDSVMVYYHDDIIVTANRTEQKVSDVSRSLTLVNKEEIDNTVLNSPVQILNHKEGMSFIGSGQTPGSPQNVFMRGVNANSTVIMIDGVRLTDPSSIENGFNFSEMSLMNISRIEIIRGAHSTLYGSSAIGGVINFITEKNRAAGFNADFSTQLGTFGSKTSLFTQNLFLNYTFTSGFYLNGEILNSSVNGIDATVDLIPASLKFKNPDRDNFERLESAIKAGFVNENWDLSIAYRLADQKADIDDGAYSDDDNAFLHFDRSLVSYGLTYKVNDNIQMEFNGGFSEVGRKSVDDSSLADALGNYDHTYTSGHYKGTTQSNDMLINYSADDMRLLIGSGLYRETMTSTNYIYANNAFGLYEAETSLDSLDLDAKTYNAYIHYDLNGNLFDPSLKAITLAAGGRFINHSSFGSTFTWDINPSYKINNTLIYASYSTGFNAPSLYRLYTPDAHFLSGITRGNPNLKPEKSTSIELGIRHSFNENHSVFASLFNNKVSDIHEYVYLWEGSRPIDSLSVLDDRGDTYINAGTMAISGIEIGFNSRFYNFLKLSANASFLTGKQKYALNDIDSRHIQGNHVQVYNNGTFIKGSHEVDGLTRRSNTANLSIEFPSGKQIHTGLLLRYVGKREDVIFNESSGPYGALDRITVKGFVLADLSIHYSILDSVQANLFIENLLNKKYSEIRGYNTRGRGFYLGLRYSL